MLRVKYSINILVLVTTCGVGCGSSPTAPTPPAPSPLAPGGNPSPPATTPRTIRTRYLAFGDSITAGTTSPAVARAAALDAGLPQSYPYKLQRLLADRYRSQSIEVVNEGKPGESAADAVRRFPGVLRTVAPEVVILLHGVNDVTFTTVAGVRRVADAINTMAQEARRGGSEVILCTMLPQRAGGLRAADPAVLAAYNTALREIARGEGARLVDFDAVGFDLRLIGQDGLHPTDDGYSRLAEIFFSQARALFEATP